MKPIPQPLHGWRAFAGEVGIIVLGVLIALAAQQAVDEVRRRAELRELRAAVDEEIARSLGTYQARMSQDQCLDRKLGQLEQWLKSWQAGRPLAFSGPISAPRSAPANTNVWESRDPAVMTHMPLATKIAYSAIYDEFANNEVQRLDERMTWFAINEFEGARTLDANAMMRLQGLLKRARWRAGNISGNGRDLIADAKKMGIKPKRDSFTAAEVAEFCQPLTLTAAI